MTDKPWAVAVAEIREEIVRIEHFQSEAEAMAFYDEITREPKAASVWCSAEVLNDLAVIAYRSDVLNANPSEIQPLCRDRRMWILFRYASM